MLAFTGLLLFDHKQPGPLQSVWNWTVRGPTVSFTTDRQAVGVRGLEMLPDSCWLHSWA